MSYRETSYLSRDQGTVQGDQTPVRAVTMQEGRRTGPVAIVMK